MSNPIYVMHGMWRVWFATDSQDWGIEYEVFSDGPWYPEDEMPFQMLSKELRDAIEHYRPGQLAILEASND